MWHRLKQLDDVRVHAYQILEIVGVADARQFHFLLIGTESREKVSRFHKKARQIELGLRRNGSFVKKFLEQLLCCDGSVFTFGTAARDWIDYQPVRAECFFVEEKPWPHALRAVKVPVDVLRIRRNVDAEFFNHA